jgi:hypothetical protein
LPITRALTEEIKANVTTIKSFVKLGQTHKLKFSIFLATSFVEKFWSPNVAKKKHYYFAKF